MKRASPRVITMEMLCSRCEVRVFTFGASGECAQARHVSKRDEFLSQMNSVMPRQVRGVLRGIMRRMPVSGTYGHPGVT